MKFKSTLRDYQLKALNMALDYFKKNKTFRFNICVGGGKTTTSVHLAMKLITGKQKIVVVCHTENLRDQFAANVATELNLTLEEVSKRWSFYTFQSLRNKTAKDIPNIGLLIIDEIHQGGQSDNGSYKKIIKTLNPKKILGLSATDEGVSEELFGKKTKKNTYTFTFNDAKKAGVLNDCKILTIHTGLEQHLSGAPDDVIRGDDIDDLQAKDMERGVNLKDEESIRAINQANIFAAVETYFAKECRPALNDFPQAAFFVGTVDQAEMCLDQFLKRYAYHVTKAGLKGAKGGEDMVRMTHSKMGETSNINDFRAKKFPVLINIRQVQEGFNDPDLELIFDCAPSFNNGGRVFIQRIGRALRTKEKKLASRYYTFYKATGGVRKSDAKEEAKRVLKESMIGFADMSDDLKEALYEQVTVMSQAELAGHNCDTRKELQDVLDEEELSLDLGSLQQPEVIDINGAFDEAGFISVISSEKPKSILVSESNFIVTKARGHKEKNQVGLHDLLQLSENECRGLSIEEIRQTFLELKRRRDEARV